MKYILRKIGCLMLVVGFFVLLEDECGLLVQICHVFALLV